MNNRYGKLFGVSVGPGDPELLTLKAVRVLNSCSAIAVPETKLGNTVALQIIENVIDLSGKQIIRLPFRMSRDPEVLIKSHEEQALMLLNILKNGNDAAMISLGDISIYSTFGYIAKLVENEGCEVERVSGVPSFCECACRLGMSLTEMNLPIHILPSRCVNEETLLQLPGSKVIMKDASGFFAIKKILREKGFHAAAVTNCGLPNEKIYQDFNDLPDQPAYFTTIIVPAQNI